MQAIRPTHPCQRCTSSRFAHVPGVRVLEPFLSRLGRAARAPEGPEAREGRSGEALVCLGCGQVQYFTQGFDSLLEQHPGATEVEVSSGPYR